MNRLDHRRAIIVVLDGVGAGALPDAARYGDAGSNTLGNLSRAIPGGLRLPNLHRLGLGNALEIAGMPALPPNELLGSYGRCREKSAGKDSTTGHWEIAGVVSHRPFPTFPHGFPPAIIKEFTRRIGRGILGNKTASGTQIIEELGAEHLRTGKPIVYTSADSVFQIAAHERVYPPEQLYELCRIAREMLTGPNAVARVIARPFIGEPGAFERTAGRHDFSLDPPEPTLLDRLREFRIETIGIGKIGDLFAHRGLTRELPTASNEEGIAATLEAMRRTRPPSFIFTNLVETDMIYGHRNDCEGYHRALQAIDARVPELLEAQLPGDLLIFTSDHGVDPTTPSTDHSREHSLLLVTGPGLRGGVDLGVRSTFADIGQTVADHLGCEPLNAGRSFLPALEEEDDEAAHGTNPPTVRAR